MDTFKETLEKILDGLNFFDFSFFISGFISFISLLYFMDDVFNKGIDNTSISGVISSIIMIYVCGIISFSIGKLLRSIVRRFREKTKRKWLHVQSFEEIYDSSINLAIEHKRISMFNADRTSLKDFLQLKNKDGRKDLQSLSYSAMWIEIRKLDESGIFYKPLYRQWVLQAVCEGLIFSFFLISILSIILLVVKGFTLLYISSIVFSIFASIASCREAQRYAENQIKELIISYYLLKEKV